MPAADGPDIVTLARDPAEGPGFLSADFVPGRGMMLLRLRALLPGRGETELVVCPPLDEALRRLSDPKDPHGNEAFAFGGALLLPFANRITGPTSPFGPLDLERNWGGKAPGSARYAMHGLILRTPFEVAEQTATTLRATRRNEDFGDRWPSRFDIVVNAALTRERFELAVEVMNRGGEPAPVGIGWHPYLSLPSGRREQARLHIPARARTPVNNYDEVLPTGELQDLAGTPYEVSDPAGRPLGDLYLDDCFTDLAQQDGVIARLTDPAADFSLTLSATAPPVRAVQVYAPPDQPFVVIEPQFNLADPFSPVWPADVDTGMVALPSADTVRYAVALTLGRAPA